MTVLSTRRLLAPLALVAAAALVVHTVKRQRSASVRRPLTRSGNRSPRAWISTPGAAPTICSAAPPPRPPQPITPTRIVSLAAAWA